MRESSSKKRLCLMSYYAFDMGVIQFVETIKLLSSGGVNGSQMVGNWCLRDNNLVKVPIFVC